MSELDDIKKNLWTGVDGANTETLIRQYELYVHQAEEISARRHSASMVFLTLSIVLIMIAVLFDNRLNDSGAAVYFLAAILLQCLWFLLARSYRNLNSAKFKVIGLMEKRLPASPFWAAEWKALGEGKDIRKYIPVSAIEHTAPGGFTLLFVLLAVL